MDFLVLTNLYKKRCIMIFKTNAKYLSWRVVFQISGHYCPTVCLLDVTSVMTRSWKSLISHHHKYSGEFNEFALDMTEVKQASQTRLVCDDIRKR